MFIDLRQNEVDRLQADICIVGAGPAGITLARQFNNSAKSVLLIEAGESQNPTIEQQDTLKGRTTIVSPDGALLKTDDHYLSGSRIKVFGGTSHHWANWCRPLDPIDFESRAWVPHSGWPITRDDLNPYYPEASRICNVPDLFKTQLDDTPEIRLGNTGCFQTQKYEIYHSGTRFGPTYFNELNASKNIKVLGNATCTNIKLSTGDSQVQSIELRTLKGKKVKIKAHNYILSCGGIENARLLMLSEQENGFVPGNHSGNLGRFFCEHPHFNLGDVLLHQVSKKQIEYYTTFKNHPKVGIFVPSKKTQAKEQILNTQIDFDPISKIPSSNNKIPTISSKFFKQNAKEALMARLRFILEPAPNPESRLTFINKKDIFGLSKIQLKVKLTELDRYSCSRLIEVLARELGANFQGRAKFRTHDFFSTRKDFESTFHQYGHHQIGTTRMHQSPKFGVVDKNCKVFGIKNLYVNGASTFTTAGHAPPTLTIVALALRMADHLKGVKK